MKCEPPKFFLGNPRPSGRGGCQLLEDIKVWADKLEIAGKITVGRHDVERHREDGIKKLSKKWIETVYTAEGLE